MGHRIYIDINCDVGEGVGNEADLLPLISSCNIACGAHAGNKETMNSVIQLAKSHQVKIGAHPSYPDRENFGRVVMDIPNQQLVDSIKEQLAVFSEAIEQQKAELHHIKPHGALYNLIADNEDMAHVFLDAIKDYKEIPVYLPYLSKIHKVAIKRGFRFYLEAFADRNYDANLRLVSRSLENAVIHNPREVLRHILKMAREEQVNTIEGNTRTIKAHTFCIHGDTPSAFKILMYLHDELPNQQVHITK